ncbi:Uncharacterized membrane-anchored protein [Cohaesibacter sp. ES.047]|uniref:GDYXXLXY domain-containing protein n=1 Tax=Cohaesibacter sp. ES.047 TaxID=1798205 RepID=UPI000BC0DFC9|nr:GDYXXLXY domain-containing protein [Cohaesibacter sp. ES.047]SNY92011.1 Uncharacterized membrane-anchored protein [Cohaesibacter sp. ES.047]
MPSRLILIALLPILVVFNYAIFSKETLRNNGELIFLELAPVDPRSLMQGDYMRLNYKIAQEAGSRLNALRDEGGGAAEAAEDASQLVLRIDGNKVAHFNRFHRSDVALESNERLFAFRVDPGNSVRPVALHPDSFFFQEGHASAFERAQYGRMRINESGDHILVGLADSQRVEIRPQP